MIQKSQTEEAIELLAFGDSELDDIYKEEISELDQITVKLAKIDEKITKIELALYSELDKEDTDLDFLEHLKIIYEELLIEQISLMTQYTIGLETVGMIELEQFDINF